ncbi:MAG TPA: hypothetical protein PLT00_16355 [Verrucomicrobiota bacterium]|jgi:FAD/FMN-containing dehydrogenase|nr:hypothetical protein [Verrucomicrobiota bacterium]OQB88432.1 MAG: hypothetical protein BWX84_03021 [Verrucomicrobia bacterium ADurb.Bin118]HPY32248.1 hypothetical protein [Verrucomicrobiota bacterium]HQB18268.1 hypothetical protein [Verrucomicrobiota bacterium]
MRMIRWGSTFTAAAMVVWVVVATACREGPGCYAPPPEYTTNDFADEWIGFTDKEGTDEVFRLVLQVDGTGMLVEAGYGVYRYAITDWKLTSNIWLRCEFERSTNRAAPLKMACRAGKRSLRAVLDNGEGGWQHHIIFMRAKELERLYEGATAPVQEATQQLAR